MSCLAHARPYPGRTLCFRLSGLVGIGALAACTGAAEEGREPGTDPADAGRVRGVLELAEPIPPTSPAYAVVTLREAGPGSRALLEQRWRLDGSGSPLSFELAVPPAILASDPPPRLRAVVVADGRPTQVSEWIDAGTAGGSHDVAMRPAPDGAFAATLICGADTASVDFDPAAVTLQVTGRTFPLARTPAASGARYEAVADTGTSVWNKGASTTLSVDGRTLPECATRETLAGTFRARGNEPFWSLVVEGSDMTFRTPDGGDLTVTAWRREDAPPLTMYSSQGSGPRIEAEVRRGPCVDSMSGMPFPASVALTVDGTEYRGCGGEPVDLLLGVEWVVEAIDARAVPAGAPPPTIAFSADGSVSGSASCNQYRGQYQLSGEGISFSPLAVTRRACPPEVMELEGAYLAGFTAVSRFDIAEDGALRLHAPDGGPIVARR